MKISNPRLQKRVMLNQPVKYKRISGGKQSAAVWKTEGQMKGKLAEFNKKKMSIERRLNVGDLHRGERSRLERELSGVEDQIESLKDTLHKGRSSSSGVKISEKDAELLIGISKKGHSDDAVAAVREKLDKIRNVAVVILDDPNASAQDNLAGLIREANSRGIEFVRLLDPELMNDEALEAAVRGIMSSIPVDIEDLRNLADSLTEDMPVIKRVDIERRLFDAWRARTLDRDPSVHYRYTSRVIANKKPFASVTTSKVIASGLDWGMRIEERRRKMGVAKNNDPVGEFIVITDRDAKDTEEYKRDYLARRGLTGYIDAANVIVASADSTTSSIAGEIQKRTRLSMDRIGIRTLDEGDIRADSEDVVTLRLRSYDGEHYANINAYEVLFELLARDSRLPNIPGLENVKAKIFTYLPPAVPIRYDRDVEEYNRYIRSIRTAA